MKIVDANVLLNAVNLDSDNHIGAKKWLDKALVGDESVGFPWLSIVAFVRIATHKSIFPVPLTTGEAIEKVRKWLANPAATIIQPGIDFLTSWGDILTESLSSGNLVNDAYIAALAKENHATVVSYDFDFERFPKVPWKTPDQLLREQ